MKRTTRCVFALIVTMILMVSGVRTIHAQNDGNPWISPGIKLGYTFGDGGGFTFGFEVSVTQVVLWSNPFTVVGGVLDWDVVPATGQSKFHLGLEGSIMMVGVDVGPTWVWDSSRRMFSGASITPFAGVFGYPYYSATFLSGRETIEEVGLYAKFPIPTSNLNL